LNKSATAAAAVGDGDAAVVDVVLGGPVKK
jgi:hypothetical protein